MKFGILIFPLFFVQSVYAGQAENIASCASKAQGFANISLDEFSARYEGNWFSFSKVRWDNVYCEAKLGSVQTLTINEKSYIYKGFAGKEAYNLNQKFEHDISIAVNDLKSKIKKLEQGVEILESKMDRVSKSLESKNADHDELKRYIDNSIKQSSNILVSPTKNVDLK